MRKDNTFGKGFLVGVLIISSGLSLAQDWAGQDNFLKYAQEHWVSGWFTIPLAILSIIFALAITIQVDANSKKIKTLANKIEIISALLILGMIIGYYLIKWLF